VLPPVSDAVPAAGAGGEVEEVSVGVGAAEVGSGVDDVGGGADVGPGVGAAVGALVACVGRDGLLVGASDRVGSRDRDGSREAVTVGRAAEPLPLVPQPTRRTSIGSATTQSSATRVRAHRGWGSLLSRTRPTVCEIPWSSLTPAG
jgi:hypothetical protein